jgi:hypothetical protein
MLGSVSAEMQRRHGPDLEPRKMRALNFPERRAIPRCPVERLAKIKLGVGTPSLHCRVSDISEGGVRINATFNGFEVPNEFVLLLSGDGPAREGTYRVIWRRGPEVGAKLVRAGWRLAGA